MTWGYIGAAAVTVIGGAINNSTSEGNPVDTADPFARRRPMYANMLQNLMLGTSYNPRATYQPQTTPTTQTSSQSWGRGRGGSVTAPAANSPGVGAPNRFTAPHVAPPGATPGTPGAPPVHGVGQPAVGTPAVGTPPMVGPVAPASNAAGFNQIAMGGSTTSVDGPPMVPGSVGGPSTGAPAAFGNSFTSDPSYQFRLQQGLENADRRMASGGFLNSGNRAAELNSYAQGQASTEFQNQFARLAQLSGANIGSPAAAAQIQQNQQAASAAGTQQLVGQLGQAAVNWWNTPSSSNGGSQVNSDGNTPVFTPYGSD